MSDPSDKHTAARRSLEETRAAFVKLVEPLNRDALKKKSVVTRRSLGAVVAHILVSTKTSYPMLVNRARRAKAMPSVIGTRLGHSLLYYLSEVQAWRKTPTGFIADYDRAHVNLLELLEGISEDEWNLRTVYPGTGKTFSIKDVFLVQVPDHFELHADEIRLTLES